MSGAAPCPLTPGTGWGLFKACFFRRVGVYQKVQEEFLYFQEQGNEKTNNGTHYKLQLLYSNGKRLRGQALQPGVVASYCLLSLEKYYAS